MSCFPFMYEIFYRHSIIIFRSLWGNALMKMFVLVFCRMDLERFPFDKVGTLRWFKCKHLWALNVKHEPFGNWKPLKYHISCSVHDSYVKLRYLLNLVGSWRFLLWHLINTILTVLHIRYIYVNLIYVQKNYLRSIHTWWKHGID